MSMGFSRCLQLVWFVLCVFSAVDSQQIIPWEVQINLWSTRISALLSGSQPWSLPTITEWSSAVWGFKTGMRKGLDSAVRVNNTSRLGNLYWAVLTDLLCSWWFWRLPWVVELGAMEGWAAVLGFFLSASGGNLWIQVQVRLVDCLQRLAGWHLPVLPWVLKVSWLVGRWVRLMNMKLIMIGQGTMPGTFRKTEHMAHS